MPEGLSVSRVVDVEVSFAPAAIPLANFMVLLLLGDSDVIDTGEVLREYNSIEEVAGDFGIAAPEYLSADRYFSQVPQPTQLMIGRWARTATAGLVAGGFLTGTEQLLTAWNTITSGGLRIQVDGAIAPGVSVSNINLSGVLNMNGVASAVQAAIRAAGAPLTNVGVTWTGDQFVVKSGTTGNTSSVAYLTPPAAGTDLATQMQLTSVTAERLATGHAAETPVAGVVRVDGRGWYGLEFAASVMPTDAENLAISGYIEASADKHVFGVTSFDPRILDANTTVDLASQLMLADYMRSFIHYSSDPTAVASWFGRAFTTNFEGSQTTLTMKFKKMPGIAPEIISATQANTLLAKRCNVYALYNNTASIVQEGMMSGLAFFDEIHGTDWLANRIQVDIFNRLYQAPKIPQTNPGVHILVTTAEAALSQAVTNGLVAPGIWNAPGFGQLQTGDFLAKGWYTFADLVENQPPSIRETRRAPLIQVAIKLAGAVHFADVLVNVNR